MTQMLESPDNDCKVASVTMFYEAKMISHETSEKIEIVSQKMKYYFLNRDWVWRIQYKILKIDPVDSGIK